MLLGILLMAFIQNATKIIYYFNGKQIEHVQTGPIIYYTIFLLILGFGLAAYYNRSNKKINYSSSLLKVETKSSMIDGLLSLCVGLALFLVSLIDYESKFYFLTYLGDAILVIILVLLIIKEPIQIIKESFIELSGGVLQNKILKKQIEEIIEKHCVPDFNLSYNYITKLGSCYLVVIYIETKNDEIDVNLLNMTKNNIVIELKQLIQTIDLEIIIK